MQFSDLPPDILVSIFKKLDLDFLYCIQLLFPFNSSSQVYRVIETVRYSRLIVTNSWRQLLRLLPRAKKIDSIDLLAKYTYVSINDFQDFLPFWETRLHPEVNVRRKIVFVLCCDHSNIEERYLTIRKLSKILKSMPKNVSSVTRQVFLYMGESQFGRELDEEVIQLLFQRVEKSEDLWGFLDAVSLFGPVGAHEMGEIRWADRYDFSHFAVLRTLCLSGMGLTTIANITFAESIRHLAISHNSLANLDKVQLPENLVTLDLSYNNLSGSFKATLPQLKVLNMRRNFIEKMMELPDSIEDLDISFNELPLQLVKIPDHLKVLRTDIAQFYLMSEKVQNRLRLQQVCVKKNIALQPNEAVYTRL